MAIQISDSQIQVRNVVAQVRYSDGFNFLSSVGTVLNRIRDEHPKWQIVRIATTQVNLRHATHPILVEFGIVSFSISLDQSRMPKIEWDKAEKFVRVFGEQLELLYLLLTESMSVKTTRRLGILFSFTAIADSVEEADRNVVKTMKSELSQKLSELNKMTCVDGLSRLTFEDAESGWRQTASVVSEIIDPEPGVENLGFGVTGTGGFNVEIDNYTRAEQGHIEKSSQLLQELFLKNRTLASALIRWAVTR